MPELTKRILAITGFFLLVVGLALGIWFLFFRPVFRPPEAPLAEPVLPTVPTVGLPPAPPAAPRLPLPPEVRPTEAIPSPVAAGGITQTSILTSAAVLMPSLSPDGSAVNYYNRADGKFYRVRPDGSAEALSDKVFFNVSNLNWAPDRNRAILEYPDGSNILYDFATGRQSTLPRHWEQFDFSPDSRQIAFLSLAEQEDSRWLAVANADGSGSVPVEPLGGNASKVQVAWSPNDQVIAFSRTGLAQGLDSQEILLVGKHGENFRSLVVNGIGFEGQWSPDGGQVLYSVASSDNDWQPQIWIAGGTPDSIGTAERPLGLNTWADKCSFSGQTSIYCAVPEELPRGAGLYRPAAQTGRDQIWRINLQTGERERVAIPSEDHNVDNLIVSSDERYLYFTDQNSGQLYKINLK